MYTLRSVEKTSELRDLLSEVGYSLFCYDDAGELVGIDPNYKSFNKAIKAAVWFAQEPENYTVKMIDNEDGSLIQTINPDH